MTRLRVYHSEDCPELAALFTRTVHTVCARDYTQPQLDAWADGQVDLAAWDTSFQAHVTLVAEDETGIVGFGDIADDGYLDRLYVRWDRQGQGIGAALCRALLAAVPAQVYTTHASLTARPFFTALGWRTVREQQVERHGILLTNFVMEY